MTLILYSRLEAQGVVGMGKEQQCGIPRFGSTVRILLNLDFARYTSLSTFYTPHPAPGCGCLPPLSTYHGYVPGSGGEIQGCEDQKVEREAAKEGSTG